MLGEHAPVRQTCQGIIVGLTPDKTFILLLVGDIGKQRHPSQWGIIRAVNGIDAEPNHYLAAITAAQPHLSLPAPLVAEIMIQLTVKPLIVVVALEHIYVTAQHILWLIPCDGAERRIDRHYGADIIQHAHRLAGVFIDGSRQLE